MHIGINFTSSMLNMDVPHKTLEWKLSLTNRRGKLGYIRKMQEINQVEFVSFQCVIFRCKWWDTFNKNNVKEYRGSGLIDINSRRM